MIYKKFIWEDPSVMWGGGWKIDKLEMSSNGNISHKTFIEGKEVLSCRYTETVKKLGWKFLTDFLKNHIQFARCKNSFWQKIIIQKHLKIIKKYKSGNKIIKRRSYDEIN